MKSVDNLMRRAVSENIFPGAVLLVAKQDTIRFFEAYGLANIFSGTAVTRETIFDLASLTKPLATTLALMQLVARAKIQLTQDLGSILPEFQNNEKAQITIKHLLYHASGLPDYRPYYLALSKFPHGSRVKALRQFLLAEALIFPVGRKVLYSDLGFMILRWVVEEVSGCRLDHFVGDAIYRSLSLQDLFFIDLNSRIRRGRFAATERCPWRQSLLEGRVHDENAFAAGGIEGHAGLFGTAEDVCRLLSALLSDYHGTLPCKLFPKDLVRTFFRRRPHTDKALGFDMPRRNNSSAGSLFSKRSVGHLGFTGTSFWMDLDRRLIVVLLTNRIHPSRHNDAIKTFRPRLHDAVVQRLG